MTVDDEADADVALVMGSEHAAPAGLVPIPGGGGNSIDIFLNQILYQKLPSILIKLGGNVLLEPAAAMVQMLSLVMCSLCSLTNQWDKLPIDLLEVYFPKWEFPR